MKKNGFTLAEVLITMSIIGVVAALTMPMLSMNVGQAKIGPSLAKFVNTFESGMQALMVENKISNLKKNTSYETALTMLTQYVKAFPYEKSEGQTVEICNSLGQSCFTVPDPANRKLAHEIINFMANRKSVDYTEETAKYDLNGDRAVNTADVAAASDIINDSVDWYQLKDGHTMFIAKKKGGVAAGPYRGAVAEVFLDIDGIQAKNKAGRDVFAFILDGSGALIPYGSKANKYANDNRVITAHRYLPAFDGSFSCSMATNASIEANFACTGQVADNSWKANY